MQFKCGDRVVYPNHGIGVIEEIKSQEIAGTDLPFYTLRILANDTVVLIPQSNADSVGLRRTISKRDVNSLFELLRSDVAAVQRSWKQRYKENSDRMLTGSIFEVAEVLKNLSHLAQSKTLSYREKRMLDKARQLVVSEVAEVQRASADVVEAEIDRALVSPAPAHPGH